MLSWLEAAPTVLAALAVLTAPGLAPAYAAGLRGIPAWGAAVPLSVTIVSCGAVAAGLAGVPWGVVPAALAALAMTLLGVTAGPRLGVRPRPDPTRVRLAAAAAVLLGGGLTAAAVMRGIGDPGRVPQTYDAVFHLNAVHRAVETGSASSLGLGSLSSPDRASAFYPGAWHAVTALTAQLTGAPAVVAVSAVSVALAALWPLGCLFLVRQALGHEVTGLVAAGLLAGGFGAAPYLLLSYGTVWPNALGTVLLPAALAALVSAGCLAVEDGLGPRRAWLVVVLAVPGLALAHPNVVVALAVYAVPVTAAAVLAWSRRGTRGARPVVSAWSAWAAGSVALLWVMAGSPVFAATRGTDWRAAESVAQAAGEALFVAPRGLPVALLPAVLALVGVAVAARDRRWDWLLGCHAATAGLYVLAAGSDSPVAQQLTGPWYNDAFRLGALLAVTAVPLAALGTSALARRAASLGDLRLGRVRGAVSTAGAAVLVGGVVLSQALYVSDNAGVVERWYGDSALAGPGERRLLESLEDVVPTGSVIAGNPWNGSALAEVLGNRTVLFPHLSGSWGTDSSTIARSMADVQTDASVCRAVNRLGVGYVLAGPSAFWSDDPRQRLYAGLDVAGIGGFEEVDSGGRLTLYRVPRCTA